jgi:hypothetical protein
MKIRHTLLAAAVFTAVLAGCNKRDEAPATPAATPPAASEPAPASSTPTTRHRLIPARLRARPLPGDPDPDDAFGFVGRHAEHPAASGDSGTQK